MLLDFQFRSLTLIFPTYGLLHFLKMQKAEVSTKFPIICKIPGAKIQVRGMLLEAFK